MNKVYPIKNIQQATNIINTFILNNKLEEKYSLNRMAKLMDYLDNPQNKLKIIHIAGTSGKTSTCYYTASLLHKAGYSVGLTVSPHIDKINERVQINLIPLEENQYCKELNQFLKIIYQSKIKPTYFEFLIAFAFWVFNKYKLDYAVIEVGIGGLLDATNIINRNDKICIITDIGIDHTEILGNTITSIAFQKAGIIQKGNLVFMNQQEKKVLKVIIEIAHKKNASLKIVKLSKYIDTLENKHNFAIFQKRNFNLALETVKYLLKINHKNKLPLKEINSAIKIHIPGRMEIIKYNNTTIILDGSHNEQKISTLVKSIQQMFPNKSIALLISFGENKNSRINKSLEILKLLSLNIIITSFSYNNDNFRLAINPKDLSEYAKIVGFKNIRIENNPTKAFDLLNKTDTNIKLVTGSFYLLNYIRPIVIK